MRKNRFRLYGLFLVLALVAAACGSGDDTGSEEAVAAEFTYVGGQQGLEADAVRGFIDTYNAETGSNISYTDLDDLELALRVAVDGGDPPAVATTPQPASICVFADEGHLVSLEDMGFDIAEMEANHSKFWMDLGLCADGNHYGIPWFPNFKSIVFYNSTVFEEEGYEIPETWDDMIALSEQAVADGYTPWCFGFESGDASGWPATDWLEDIVVRQSGGETYANWFNHDIPFNDAAIVDAFDLFGELFFGEGFVVGGAENAGSVNFGDAPIPLFAEDPHDGCLMLKQGSFISNFFVDAGGSEEQIAAIKTFPFPSINGNGGAMGGGDTIIVFDGSDEIVSTIKAWITPEWQCAHASANGGGVSDFGGHGVDGVEFLPGHKDVNPDCYDTEASKAFAGAVTGALGTNTFVFDASDLMPPEIGQGAFWEGMINWSRGTSTQETVDFIEAAWPSS